MGADFYPIARAAESDGQSGQPPLGVGEGSTIVGAIVDKNCQIGSNARIASDVENPADADLPHVSIRDGIIVVHKGAIIGDGWHLKRMKDEG
jgi:glucose-1-phosphate adenylyltransferase